jgi:S-adenosylmethionine synthetase
LFQVVASHSGPGAVEFVERKGRGHPDSLADSLAELISYEYARYCVAEFGVIPHHYVDKLVIGGGEARVSPGRYTQVRPLRIQLNGRFSHAFGSVEIPVTDIARSAVAAYLPLVLPGITESHWELADNLSRAAGSSAKGWHWWSPRGTGDLPDFTVRLANDTAVAVARFPRTPVEAGVLEAEQRLFEELVADGRCGSDIKILASRIGGDLSVTACVPVMASAIGGRADYDRIKAQAARSLEEVLSRTAGVSRVQVMLNSRDGAAPGDLYLLGLGTAAEHGDIGAVGRGNRMSGVITTDAPMSADAPWGKNPVYFTGLVYDSCAREVSRSIHDELGLPNTTYLASQNGRRVSDPWRAVVSVPAGLAAAETAMVEKVSEEAFARSRKVPALLADIRGRYPHLHEICLP